MIVIGLDLSTKAGYAIVNNGNLADFGLIKAKDKKVYSIEDFNMILKSKDISDGVYKILASYLPDSVFVEQTNSGRFRSSQKQLEFIHFAFLNSCIEELGIPDKIKYIDTSRWRSVVGIKLSKEQKKHNKLVKNKFAKGKITPKHLAVKWVNEKFNLNLKLKDNDIADAICIAYAGWLQASNPKIKQQSLNSALFK